jgi:hypothetical protein
MAAERLQTYEPTPENQRDGGKSVESEAGYEFNEAVG